MVPALKRDFHDEVVYAPPRRRRAAPRAEAGYEFVSSGHEPLRGATAPARRPRGVSPYVVVPVVGLLLLCAGMAFVAQRVQVMALNYALIEAKAELAKLQQERTRLEAELARKRSLEHVEYLARTRLGMVDADPTAVVVVAGTGPVTAAQGTAEPDGQSTSPLAAVGEWLRSRLQETAAAGGRWQEP